ncbi:MAG: hypothetical protein J3Q66DRAFT_407583 [Benniella sp.]|nr:MAG: hypothetical protein J3Q66DRAFT_407583 [Benniella sp.]
MSPTDPFEIPEVASHIASYLSDKDLGHCVRVSKSWHGIFLPHRWQEITTYEMNWGSYKHSGPSQEALRNHRYLVQDLSILWLFRKNEMCTHPNLRHLRIEFNVSQRRLQLGSHPSIMPDAVSGFWEACRNFESLSMNSVRFEEECVPFSSDTVFGRMRTLVMKDVEFGQMRPLEIEDGELTLEQLAIVFQCPILESFELEAPYFGVRMAIHHPLQKERWSQLDHLKIPCNSTVILSVLCSCSALEVLHAQSVSVKDIAEGEPWVCRHLRELQVLFFCEKTDQELQPLVFERLSTLARLVTLDMDCDLRILGDKGLLEFRLDCGMGQLASLQELRTVVFSRRYTMSEPMQQLEMKDVEWMIGHWKKLKGIHGDLNDDPQASKQVMLTQNPLELPEVAALIASYLQEALNKHRHLVRDLTLEGDFCEDDMCPHPNLRYLKIIYQSRNRPLNDVRELFNWDLAGISPLLDRLELLNFSLDRRSCQRLLEHTHLRSLELWNAIIMPDAGQEIWEAFKNLEILSLSWVESKDDCHPIPTDTVFTRLRTLIMKDVSYLSLSQQLCMVLRCPRLKSFELKSQSFVARMTINHPVQKDRWSQFDNLNIPLSPSDKEWASILERIGNCFENVSCLHLHGGLVGPRSLKALGSYFSNLVDLRFAYGDSSVILNVLCSCPKLEILHGPVIFTSDIVKGGPWVCQQLRELEIRIFDKETEQDLQPMVFERLSTLVRLTTLNLSWATIDSGRGCRGVLQFRLDRGLGQLASLRELRTVIFDQVGPRQQLEMKDVKWMIDNWKKLKGLYGFLNRDPEVGNQLRGLLDNHGILHTHNNRSG